MKLFPTTLSAVPLLLLSSFLSLAPLSTEAATGREGPSHFIIETPSSKSPWKADSVNPLAWTFSKSAYGVARRRCRAKHGGDGQARRGGARASDQAPHDQDDDAVSDVAMRRSLAQGASERARRLAGLYGSLGAA
jgi:hypothetical protein